MTHVEGAGARFEFIGWFLIQEGFIMPLFIPFMLGAAALSMMGVGAAKGVGGMQDMSSAKELAHRATHRHGQHIRAVEGIRTSVNHGAAIFGQMKLETQRDTFGRMVKVLETLAARGHLPRIRTLASVDIEREFIGPFRAEHLSATTALTGIARAGAAGVGAASSMYTLAGLVGVASTGAALSGLSGAAATSATLAWFGGGSLAAGGFGMAGGTLVLGGVVAGPAILVVGFALASAGEQALTDALRYCSKVERAVADLKTIECFLRQVAERVEELYNVAIGLRDRANRVIGQLEGIARMFDTENPVHMRLLMTSVTLTKALSEVLKAPVLTSEGELETNTARVIAKHRDLAGLGSGH